MYTIQPKKMLIMNILEVLKKYSDDEHRLSQKDIENLLEKEYSMKADRKTIKRNLMDLIDAGYDIEYTEVFRNGKNGDETICTDWYLKRDFSDAELRLLIDSILFAKHIPYKQCRQLISKLEGLSSKYFSANAKHIRNVPLENLANPQLFFTIEIIDEAIDKNCKVEFSENFVDYNKKREIRVNDSGEPMRFVFNPYQMVAVNNHYYVIGNYEKYDDLTYVRMDHISDIKILKQKVKPKKEVRGLENGLNMPQHMTEHIYMMYGDTVKAKFRCHKFLSDQLVDWFGLDYKVVKTDGDFITVQVDVNERAMRFWALQYGTFVEVLEPKSLRDKIKKSIKVMNENYGL